MRGITIIFNDERIHTGNTLDLVQEKKEIGKPDIQYFTVQVPGRNGSLNLTKSLTGKVSYHNRSLSFQYFGAGTRDRLLYLDNYMSRFHGQTIRIIDDDYPYHYYEGEASVSTVFNGNYITITLTVDAQPFRLKISPFKHTRNVDGTIEMELYNDGHIDVIPVITVTAEFTIKFDDKTVTLSAGTYTVDNLVLHSGYNKIEVSGAGSITIEYQEGEI